MVIPVEYDQTARKRLGRAMRAARVDAGYKRREDFAAKIGRSGRQVQALENGESGVGPDTWAAAAAELGWPLENVYAILDGAEDAIPPSSSTALAAVSDEELVAEVLRRIKAGEGHDTGSAPIGDRRRQDRELFGNALGDLDHDVYEDIAARPSTTD